MEKTTDTANKDNNVHLFACRGSRYSAFATPNTMPMVFADSQWDDICSCKAPLMALPTWIRSCYQPLAGLLGDHYILLLDLYTILLCTAPVIFKKPYPYPCFLFFSLTDGPGYSSTKVPSPRAGKSKFVIKYNLLKYICTVLFSRFFWRDHWLWLVFIVWAIKKWRGLILCSGFVKSCFLIHI